MYRCPLPYSSARRAVAGCADVQAGGPTLSVPRPRTATPPGKTCPGSRAGGGSPGTVRLMRSVKHRRPESADSRGAHSKECPVAVLTVRRDADLFASGHRPLDRVLAMLLLLWSCRSALCGWILARGALPSSRAAGESLRGPRQAARGTLNLWGSLSHEKKKAALARAHERTEEAGRPELHHRWTAQGAHAAPSARCFQEQKTLRRALAQYGRQLRGAEPQGSGPLLARWSPANPSAFV